jgi:hypothetical protein
LGSFLGLKDILTDKAPGETAIFFEVRPIPKNDSILCGSAVESNFARKGIRLGMTPKLKNWTPEIWKASAPFLPVPY